MKNNEIITDVAIVKKPWFQTIYPRFIKPLLTRKTFSILGVLALIGFGLLSVAAAYLWTTTPSIDALVQQNESSIVYARDGKTELFKFFDEEKRKVIPLKEIPETMQLAIIGLEQENYYQDEQGIPWKNLAGATFKCFTSRNECRGASGLSQQFIKNYTDDNSPSVARKARELFTSIKLNQEKTKEDVLGLYLNEVPFGRNAYGIEEAAKAYFKDTPGNVEGQTVQGAKDITIIQACYLASMPQRTTFYSKAIDIEGKPIKTSSNWLELEYRKNVCLEKLHTKELRGPGSEPVIKTKEELDNLQKTEIPFSPSISDAKYGHFKDYIADELIKIGIKDVDLKTRGYKIVSSLDPAIQDATDQIMKDYKPKVDGFGADNAASVVLDGPTGQIVAMNGSLDYNNVGINGQFNVALSPQQPGSSIKPYEYAAALENDFNPGTVIQDVATEFQSGFTPTNFNRGSYKGSLTLRSALQNSYNTPAVKAAYLGTKTTPNTIPSPEDATKTLFQFTKKVGVQFPCQPAVDGKEVCATSDSENAYQKRCFLASTIGACELSMLSHVGGFNTFAQNGKHLTPTPFISIIDLKTGTDIYANIQSSGNPAYPVDPAAVDPLVAKQMNQIMSDYKARYPAFCNGRADGCELAYNLELQDRKAAAKTGTTDESRDTWTVGYTPQYTVATWVGRNDNEKLNITGSSAAAPLWNQIMTKIHEGKDVVEFPTDGLQLTKLNRQSGLLDPNGYDEWLSPKQIAVLKEAQTKLNSGTYNPYEGNIFTNRTPIISRKVKVNKLDGKLAVDGKTLPENIEEKVQVACISEFPQSKIWTKQAGCKGEEVPTEKSEQDQVAEQKIKPTVTTNLKSGQSAPTTITVDAKLPSGSIKKITSIELFIDGTSVSSSQNATLSFKPTTTETKTKTVLIKVTDSYGSNVETTFKEVEFEKTKPADTPPTDKTPSSTIVDTIQNLINGTTPPNTTTP
jgi:membrane peptidoglycan carboxypeptidase